MFVKKNISKYIWGKTSGCSPKEDHKPLFPSRVIEQVGGGIEAFALTPRRRYFTPKMVDQRRSLKVTGDVLLLQRVDHTAHTISDMNSGRDLQNARSRVNPKHRKINM